MSREILREMRHEPQSLRPHVDRVRAGELSPEYNKADAMALSAIFIEKIWQEMHGWIDANQGALPDKKVVNDVVEFVPCSPDWSKAIPVPENMLAGVRDKVLAFATEHTKQWRIKMEARLQSFETLSPEEEQELKNYQRLKEMAGNGDIRGNALPVDIFILNGFGTANSVIANFLKVIPHVYRKTHPRQFISGAQAEEIFRESRRTILAMAAMGVSNLIELDHELGKETEFGKDRENYDPKNFHIATKGEGADVKLAIEIDRPLLMSLRQKVKEEEVTTGCPALVATGPGGQNVVLGFYDWMLAIAKVHYFPMLDRIKEKAARY